MCVCAVHALPCAGNPPTVLVQWPAPLCFSSEPIRVFPLQGQTGHSRWLNLRQIHVHKVWWWSMILSMIASLACEAKVCISYWVYQWGRVPPSCVGTSALVLQDCLGSAWHLETWTDSVSENRTFVFFLTLRWGSMLVSVLTLYLQV